MVPLQEISIPFSLAAAGPSEKNCMFGEKGGGSGCSGHADLWLLESLIDLNEQLRVMAVAVRFINMKPISVAWEWICCLFLPAKESL